MLLGTFFATAGFSQSLLPSTAPESKLRFHLEKAYSPEAVAESAALAGYFQAVDSPREWGQGASGFGRRMNSALAYSGVRNAIAFGLDSALHQDPRYYRSTETGAWRRTKHVLRSTIMTRTDSGGETLATWRLGSAFSAPFIANQWCPDRVNTYGLSLREGVAQLGFDALANFRSEFGPDMKKKLLHRR